MISSTMQEALNAQINLEQYSSQLYLALSAHLGARNYKGFAHWLRVQASEETEHASKLIDFLIDRGGTLELRTVTAPKAGSNGVIQVFETVLAHEQDTTAAIHALFATARSDQDFASEITLQWYVTEQVGRRPPWRRSWITCGRWATRAGPSGTWITAWASAPACPGRNGSPVRNG
jgi:ferritin